MEITVEDCVNLRKEFDEYVQTAEQHEFILLFMIDQKLKSSVERYVLLGMIPDQSDARAMFRTVYRVLGKDFSKYLESNA